VGPLTEGQRRWHAAVVSGLVEDARFGYRYENMEMPPLDQMAMELVLLTARMVGQLANASADVRAAAGKQVVSGVTFHRPVMKTSTLSFSGNPAANGEGAFAGS
jgi:hypothetical protein